MVQEKNKKTPVWLVHICAWVVYSSFIYIANRLSKPNITVIEVAFFLLPFCTTFYVSLYSLGLYKKRGLLWGILTFLIVFIVMSALGYCYIYLLLPLAGMKLYTSNNYRLFLESAILGYVQYSAYAMLYFYVRETVRTGQKLRWLQEEKLQLEKQKMQRELENAILKQQELKSQQDKLQYEYAFLRSQINPHFLHNTLNVLFSQALEFSQELADNILKLSGMMRYSLESVEFESGKVPIEKELEHLQTLLDIHNLRFGDTKIIQYSTEGEVQGQILPPLSIITIVENAFKYGDLKDPSNPLLIKVRLLPQEIYFYCRNKKRKNNIQLSSLNIGITNLSKRLDVAFKDMYEMKATNEDDFYTFELTIKN